MADQPRITLNNGVEIPAFGLGKSRHWLLCSHELTLVGSGTWQSKPEEVVHAVEYALKEAGYRHIDCAWCVLLIELV